MRSGLACLSERMTLCSIDRSGGGSKVSFVSPNYSFINKLREKDGLPPLLPKKDHKSIKNIIIFDDDDSVSELFSDFLTVRIRQLTGAEPKIIRPNEEPSPTAINIIVANLPNEVTKAFDRYQSLSPNFVITDFNMNPRGDQTTKRLRDAGFSGFIIGITGRPENRTVFYTAGTDLALVKPVDLKTFEQLLK